jgi:hypothetical protein
MKRAKEFNYKENTIMDKSSYSCKNVKPEVWSINAAGAAGQSGAYSLNNSGDNGLKTVRINFLTPFRLQHKGRYLSSITYNPKLPIEKLFYG